MVDFVVRGEGEEAVLRLIERLCAVGFAKARAAEVSRAGSLPGIAMRREDGSIDESTAVATTQPTLRSQRLGFWVTGLVIFVGWNITTLVGAILGDVLGDVRQYGWDAAAAAAFLGLLWPRLRELQPIVVAVAACVVATVLTPVLSPGIPILAAAAVAAIVGAFNLWGRPAS